MSDSDLHCPYCGEPELWPVFLMENPNRVSYYLCRACERSVETGSVSLDVIDADYRIGGDE